MGGLDCEVDVVESVDTAVEAEGAVESAEVVVGAEVSVGASVAVDVEEVSECWCRSCGYGRAIGWNVRRRC